MTQFYRSCFKCEGSDHDACLSSKCKGTVAIGGSGETWLEEGDGACSFGHTPPLLARRRTILYVFAERAQAASR
jgi:hypothetical protein